MHLWSRLGNEKTRQFPEIAAALEKWAGSRRQPLVLDGEIVALDEKGNPAGFQQLQGRIHLTDGEASPAARTALIAFDILQDGTTNYRDRPLTERRARAREDLRQDAIADAPHQRSGRAATAARCTRRALEQGWEGLIAKHVGVALPVGQTLSGLAQAQARPRTGIRRRRLDRAAPARARTLARCCWACTTAAIGVRRAHRHGLQRKGTGAGDEAA